MLAGTYRDNLVQLPDNFRANQKLTYIIEGTAQMPCDADTIHL